MKKLLTCLLLCLAVFCGKAQVTVILEAHDVWGDQSGYQLLLDADATAFGTIIPETGGLSSGGDVPAATYAEFEYKVPANADGALTTTHIVYDGTDTITIPAGTYDFCVTNPTPDDRVWIASGDYGRRDNFVFRDNCIYHFTVAMNGQNDNVSLVITPTVPMLLVDPAEVNFGYTLLDQPAVSTVDVAGYLFTDSITATVDGAQFSIAFEDTIFGTSVQMPSNGGTLYVKYAPAAVEVNNGTITLTCGDSVATVALTGEGFECTTVNTFPYEIDFTNDAMNSCWSIVDANNDSSTFVIANNLAYYAYSSTNNADDWLISPSFLLTGNEYAAFDYAVRNSSYPEKFEVYVIQGEDTALVVEEVEATNTSLNTQVVDLRNYTGEAQVAIRCTSEADQYYFMINSFMVSDEPVFDVDAEEIDYNLVVIGRSADRVVTLSTVLVNEDIVVTTQAPFSLSLDGNDTTFTATITLPADTAISRVTSFYVRYTPTADTILDEDIVTFVADTFADTVRLRGMGFECVTITEFPYQTNFTNDTLNLCWTIDDDNNDDNTFAFSTQSGYAYYNYSADTAANDWLTSPTFLLTGNEYFAFSYSAAGGSSYPEKFEVYVIQDSLTLVVEPTVVENTENRPLLPVDLRSFTGECQIAIHCISDADMYAFIVTDFIVDSVAHLEATLEADPTSIDFGSLVLTEGINVSETATVSTIMIEDTLTVTTAAPFAVSLDGTTYSDNVTIVSSGLSFAADFHVRYAPTAAGTHTGTVTITDGTHTATIALNGSAVDCNEALSLPFVEDFEDELSACWQNIDSDGDGYTWDVYTGYEEYAHTGAGFAASASYANYVGPLTPNNWLITPAIAIPAEAANIGWWDAAVDGDYPAEHYEVKVSATGTAASDFTTVWQNTLNGTSWTHRSVNLEQYAGQTIYIAFVHNNCTDQNMLLIDDINVSAGLSGVEESEISAVSIYPNPASTVLNVHAENFDNVQIINFLGQVVYSANVTANDFQINVSDLSNGVYFIRLNGETTTTQKFIKR